MNNIEWFLIGMAAGLLTMLLMGGYSGWQTQEMTVKSGHAEYYLDSNHNRQWRWLPTPAPSK